MEPFYIVLLLILAAKPLHGLYEHFHFGLVLWYSHLHPDHAILNKVDFWWSFIVSDLTTVQKVIQVCIKCEVKKEGHNWRCTWSSFCLAESVILNILSIYVAWQSGRTTNEDLEFADTTVLKRHATRRRDLGKVLLLSFLAILPVMWLVSMKYPIMELIKGTFNYMPQYLHQ
ncbi:hypothetical protein MOSE0_C00210 [Monosporozyma servazzii]